MDKDILYRFFEGCASVEEIRQVKEWAEASDEHRKSLRRERKLFNAMILAGQPVQKDMRMTIMRETEPLCGRTAENSLRSSGDSDCHCDFVFDRQRQ
ncbi:hypothetical protein NXX09_10390 [Bacteroides uniformis]|nr:hypothetical protein [Bacteroides uniformis]